MLYSVLRCRGILYFLPFFFIPAQIALGAQIKIAWDPNTEYDLAEYKTYSKKITYGIYEIGGAVSEKGVFSGKLDPVPGKFNLRAMSDDAVSYTQSGVVKP